jgi:hypothetical protein
MVQSTILKKVEKNQSFEQFFFYRNLLATCDDTERVLVLQKTGRFYCSGHVPIVAKRSYHSSKQGQKNEPSKFL